MKLVALMLTVLIIIAAHVVAPQQTQAAYESLQTIVITVATSLFDLVRGGAGS